MVSTSQIVLLSDSNIGLVQNLHNSNESKTDGMIGRSDYWKLSISPFFYNISEVLVNEKGGIRKYGILLFIP